MSGIGERSIAQRSRYRRFGALFRDVQQPGDFTHHAVVRDADPRLFDALYRELRRRLYDGSRGTQGGNRWASLRQGVSGRLGSVLFVLGWLTMASGLLVGSDLGRSFHQLEGTGGMTQAAASQLFPFAWMAAGQPLTAVALSLIAAGVMLSLLSRRHFWLMSHRVREGRIDVWIAGTSWRREGQFEREFSAFARRAEELRQEIESQERGATTTEVLGDSGRRAS